MYSNTSYGCHFKPIQGEVKFKYHCCLLISYATRMLWHLFHECELILCVWFWNSQVHIYTKKQRNFKVFGLSNWKDSVDIDWKTRFDCKMLTWISFRNISPQFSLELSLLDTVDLWSSPVVFSYEKVTDKENIWLIIQPVYSWEWKAV